MKSLTKSKKKSFSEESEQEAIQTGEAKPEKKKGKIKKFFTKKRSLKTKIIAIVLIVALVAGCFFAYNAIWGNDNSAKASVTAKVTRGTVSSMVEGSGTIEAIQQYDITSLKKGEVKEDYFAEGDTVEKDAKLYQMDNEEGYDAIDSAQDKVDSQRSALETAKSSITKKQSSLSSASDSIASAQASVSKAQRTLDDANSDLTDLVVKAGTSGVITNVYIKNGDKLSANAKVCDIVNRSQMILEIQFLSDYASQMYAGSSYATVTLSKNGTTLGGRVTKVSSGSILNSVGAQVTNVEITVSNPGAIQKGDYATAEVNGLSCSSEGSFKYTAETTVYASVSGDVVNVSHIAGDEVSANSTIAVLTNTATNDAVKNAREALAEAQRSLVSKQRSYSEAQQDIKDANQDVADAQRNLEKAQKDLADANDALEDYVVTAPISGKIIQKNIKAGEKLDNNSDTTMAIIADLSSLVFDMSVDELDISSISVGMDVDITADAVENVTFAGTVTNISIVGTSENGVTSYPVKVTIKPYEQQENMSAKKNYEKLIPGLNVSAKVVIEEAEDVLMVPVSAVRRGNYVIVKDDSTAQEATVEEAMSIAQEAASDKQIGSDAQVAAPMMGADAKVPERRAGSNAKVPVGSDGTTPQETPPAGARSSTANAQSDRDNHSTTASDSANDNKPAANATDSKAEERLKNMKNSLGIPAGYKAVLVQTGLSDDSYIEIKKGLNEGDTVLLPDTTKSTGTATQMGGMPGGMGGGMPSGSMGGGMPGGMGGGMPSGSMGGSANRSANGNNTRTGSTTSR